MAVWAVLRDRESEWSCSLGWDRDIGMGAVPWADSSFCSLAGHHLHSRNVHLRDLLHPSRNVYLRDSIFLPDLHLCLPNSFWLLWGLDAS